MYTQFRPTFILTLAGGVATSTSIALHLAEPSGQFTLFAATAAGAFGGAATTSVPVQPGSFTRLQTLLPGESASPGAPTGKIGSPAIEVTGVALATVKVRATDGFFNLISGITDAVSIAAPGAPTANVPSAPQAMSGGVSPSRAPSITTPRGYSS